MRLTKYIKFQNNCTTILICILILILAATNFYKFPNGHLLQGKEILKEIIFLITKIYKGAYTFI